MAKVEQFPDPSGEKTIEQDIKAQKTKEITKEVRDQIKEAVPEQTTDTRVGQGGDRLAGEDAGTGRDRSAEGIPDPDRARMEENDEGGAREPRKRTLPDDTLLMGSSADKRADAGKGARGDARRGARRDSQEDEDGENVLIGFPGLFRKKKEEGASNLSYQEKIRRYRAKNRTYRFFAAVIAVMAVLLVVLFMMNRHYNRAEIVKIRDFVAEEGAVCANFDGCVLQYGPNGAVCADTNGHVKWSITYEMDEPIISIRGKIAAIADYGGRTIYVMNKKKQLYTVSTSLPIHKVEASECGEVAASSLMMKDMSVVSNLTFYDFGKAGKNYEQHVAASFEYENEVLPYVWFMGNNRCAAVSDSRFVVFDTSGTEPKNSINNMLTENLQGLFEDGDHVGLLFNDLTQENMYRLDLYDQNGQKEGDVGFTMAYNDLQMTGGRVYINNEQTMQIYTTDGKEIFNGGFDRAIKVLIPSRWLGGLTAVSENEIDAIKLR